MIQHFQTVLETDAEDEEPYEPAGLCAEGAYGVLRRLLLRAGGGDGRGDVGWGTGRPARLGGKNRIIERERDT